MLHDSAKLAPFIIHRNYIHGRKLSDVTEVELHGFSDARGKAYACVIYLRVLFKNGDILTTFIASKSRVAPIKHFSIPRLELMACLILVRLMSVTLKSLADYVIYRVFCWSDSTDCLFWIDRREKLWCRFVQNRVSEIRERLPTAKWRFCPGEKNPADIPSRGLDLSKSERREKWLHGPDFLRNTKDCWPRKKMDVTPCNVNEALDNKVRSTVGINSVLIKTECEIDQIIKKHSFHSFKKLRHLVRNKRRYVTSYVIRFVMNCKRAINREDLKFGEISLDEKKHAKLLWL